MSLQILKQDFINLYEEATSIPYEFLNVIPAKKQFLQEFHTKLKVVNN